jgi:glutamate-1-semialdehyde 2,1-aminomutase
MSTSYKSAVAALERRYLASTPRSREHFLEAEQLLPAGNTRNNLFFAPYMPYLESAEGEVLTDIDGNRYTDLLNDFTVAMSGHSNQIIAKTIQERVERGLSLGGATVVEASLAQELRTRFPGMELLRFCNSGTEANLYAVQAATLYAGRKQLLVFDGNYHGGIMNYAHAGPLMNLPLDTVVVPYNDPEAFERAMRQHGGSLGAVVIELMMNSGGCIPGDRDFVALVRRLTAAYDVPLIVDEVMTSRMRYHGLQESYGIQADLTTLGKMIGGGFSAGAFGGRSEIMACYDSRRQGSVPHGGSFNNNVMSMACGLAALTRVLTADEMLRVSAMGNRLRDDLNAVFARADVPLCMTGLDSACNLHFGRLPPSQIVRDSRDGMVHTLFHRASLLQGFWIATRALVALSVETSTSACSAFTAFAAEFSEQYGALLRSLEDGYAQTGTN